MENGANNALIVGSNAGLRDMVRTNLRGMGFTILECTPSAEVALDTLSDEKVTCDLIISELHVDGMSCKRFLTEIRTMPDFDRSMIVLLASEDESELLEECLEHGIAGVIKKPFNNDNFASLLQAPYHRLKYLSNNFKALFLSTFATFSESQCRFRTAVKYYEESLKEADAAILHFELGRLYLLIKKKEEAVTHFVAAETLNQSFAKPIEKLLAQFKVAQEDEAGIPKSAIKAFLAPLKQYGNVFHNSHRIRKCMVIGGNHVDRVSIKNFMGNLGIKNVLLHDNPESALKVLRDCDVDVVIAWLRLGSSDAVSLTKVVRGIYNSREMKIVVVVGEGQSAELSQVLEAGADGYFIPPFIAERFCQRMHRCMVLQDLTRMSGISEQMAKTAYAMYECGDYARGQSFAEKGIAVNPHDSLCELFLAMNKHIQFDKWEAYRHYDNVVDRSPELTEMVGRMRAEIEAICEEVEKKKAKKEKQAAMAAMAAEAAVMEEKAPRPKKAEIKVIVEEPIEKSAPASEPVDALGPDPGLELDLIGGVVEPPEEKKTKKKRRTVDASEVGVVAAVASDELKLGEPSLEEGPSAPLPSLEDLAPPPPPTARVPATPVAPFPAAAPQEAPKVASAPPPVQQPPPKVELVKRKRVQIKKEMLGQYQNVESLQKEIFGKVEPVQPFVGISKLVLDQGVSEVDLIQPLGLERVFSGTKESVPSDFGTVTVIENVIVPWLATETIEQFSFTKEFGKGRSGGTRDEIATVVEGEKTESNDLSLMAGQARLLNSRVICLPDHHTGTQNLLEYLTALGKVVAENDLVKVLDMENQLDEHTRKLLEDVKGSSGDSQKAAELGRTMVNSSIADDLFLKMASGLEEESSQKTVADSMSALQQPLVKFHRECLGGKKEFENELPYVLESIAKGVVDFEMIYKAMEQDHNSLESFKKIYFALGRARKREELDRFFNEKYKDYLKNSESAEALRRFLLLMGDARRLKLIGPKANSDEIKWTALEWYKKSEFDRVINCCTKLIRRQAHLEFAYNMLGVVYRKMGKIEDAIAAYEKGIEFEPESVKLHHNVSIAYSVHGEPEKARRASEKARILKETRGGLLD